MKVLLFIVLVAFCMETKAQNRWMFMSRSTDNLIYLVDTLKEDIKQVDYFGGHKNIVIAWFNIYQKVKTKKGGYTKSHVEKVAIDTLNKQIATIFIADYKNEAPVISSNFALEWDDTVPGTMAEIVYLQFAKSLNNYKLSVDLYVNALHNHNPYDKSKQ
jgi:hypothetical protein